MTIRRIFVGILLLAGMGILFALPILIYNFGVPFLPFKPRASDSQLGLFYVYYTPAIGVVVWIGKRWPLSLLQIGNPQAKTLKSQASYPSYPQALPGTYQDPIVIGGGREKNEILCWYLIIIGIVSIFSGSIGSMVSKISGDSSAPIELLCFDMLGLALIIAGIFLRPYGKHRECVKIGSEGIAHYSREKGNVFIPWDEMSRAYVDVHYFFRYLYIVLEDDSNLFYEKPIKLRYEANIGESGAVMICQVSKSRDAVIHEHLVERALRRYAPPRLQ